VNVLPTVLDADGSQLQIRMPSPNSLPGEAEAVLDYFGKGVSEIVAAVKKAISKETRRPAPGRSLAGACRRFLES
jgi:hypothetical protein